MMSHSFNLCRHELINFIRPSYPKLMKLTALISVRSHQKISQYTIFLTTFFERLKLFLTSPKWLQLNLRWSFAVLINLSLSISVAGINKWCYKFYFKPPFLNVQNTRWSNKIILTSTDIVFRLLHLSFVLTNSHILTSLRDIIMLLLFWSLIGLWHLLEEMLKP
jgi:hypothetical protein